MNNLIISATASSNSSPWAIIWVIGALGSASICGLIAMALADKKGNSKGLGFVLGFFLGLIGIIIAAVMSPPQKPQEKPQVKKHSYWKCPQCNTENAKDALFCPKCGTKFDVSYIINSASWVCDNCHTQNISDAKYCKNCGSKKPTINNSETKQFIEENGIECDLCGKKSLKNYYVKITDDMGTRYRNVCPDCLEQYNCTILDENHNK